MLDRLRSVLPLVAFALLPACAAEANDPRPEVSNSDGSNTPTEKTTKSARLDGVDLPGTTLPSHQQEVPSAGTFDLSLDGVACTVLQTGLQKIRTGWTLTAQANCGYMVTLKISGRTDVHYPQTELNPFGSEQAATLDVMNSDKHRVETFSTWQEGTEVYLENGPTDGAHAPVEGMALVGEGSVDHYLRFKLHY